MIGSLRDNGERNFILRRADVGGRELKPTRRLRRRLPPTQHTTFIAFYFIPNYIHDACAVLACLSHNAFVPGSRKWIHTSVFSHIIRDIGNVFFDMT